MSFGASKGIANVYILALRELELAAFRRCESD
jgi:hypothetical protein